MWFARAHAGLAAALFIATACARTAPPACTGRCLTIAGTKDPDHRLQFTVRYVTTSTAEACVTTNRMAGVTTARTQDAFMPAISDGRAYEVAIPLDQQVGGACDWRAVAVSLHVVSNASRREPPVAGGTLVTFAERHLPAPGAVTMQCRRLAYTRATGEQASYACAADGLAGPLELGEGSHRLRLDFTTGT